MIFNWSQWNNETVVLLSLFLMLLIGFMIIQITDKLKLPDVTGYILAGILIGPHLLNLIPGFVTENMDFVTDIALAFVAFDVERFFKKEIFKKSGVNAIVITIAETLAAGLLITAVMYYLFRFSLDFSLLLGAIATATSPASTMMTIKEYKAKGSFVHILLQIVALDDVVSLILFSIASTVVSANQLGEVSFRHVILPFIINLLFIILGMIMGLILSKLLGVYFKRKSNRLMTVLISLLGLSGLGSIYNISPLLSCMVFSTVYINLTEDEALYREHSHFQPPILALFFITSGMTLDMSALVSLGTVGLVYFILRIVGKYLGAYLGSRMLPKVIGDQLLTIILASSVLYELIGPVSAKWALFRSGAIRQK